MTSGGGEKGGGLWGTMVYHLQAPAHGGYEKTITDKTVFWRRLGGAAYSKGKKGQRKGEYRVPKSIVASKKTENLRSSHLGG